MLSGFSIEEFLVVLYALIADVKKIATIIGKMLSYLPSWVTTVAGISFCLIVITVLYKQLAK